MEKNSEYWTARAEQGLSWLEKNDAGAFGQVLNDTLNLLIASANEPEEAERLWGAVRSVAGMLPNSFIKKGRGSSLDPQTEASVASVLNQAETVIAPHIEENFEFLQMVMFPHGRTGGEYTDASHMVKDQMRTIKRNLMKALKENRWDGKSENGVPVGMTPPALNDSDGGDSEE